MGTTGGVEVTTLGGLGGRMERRMEWREEEGPHGRGTPVEAGAATGRKSGTVRWGAWRRQMKGTSCVCWGAGVGTAVSPRSA